MKTSDITEHSQIRLAFTRTEAAASLGVSPMTLDRLTRRKLLNPTRATRRPLYSRKELERFLRDNRVSNPQKAQKISPATGVCAPEQGRGKSKPNERQTE